MNSKGAALIAVLSAAVALSLGACSHSDEKSITGQVQSVAPSFCLGAADAEGTCFVTAGASGTKDHQLKVGDCVKVTYSEAADNSPGRATRIAPAKGC